MSIDHLIRHTRGAAGVEFALVVPMFLVLLFGIEELARYVAAKQDLMSAVHAAGRYAIVHGAKSSLPASTADLQQYVDSKLALIAASSITVTANFSPNNSPGSTVTIRASYNWMPIVPLLHFPNVQITATSVATILN